MKVVQYAAEGVRPMRWRFEAVERKGYAHLGVKLVQPFCYYLQQVKNYI